MNGTEFKKFGADPFGFFDNLNLHVGSINLNLFQKYVHLRRTILVMAFLALAGWMVFGFDSTPMQIFNPFMELFPNLLMGKISFGQFGSQYVERFNYYYGKEMHYSAFVIYGLLFVVLSRHFQRQGIVKSKNVVYATGLTALSIAVFEFYWMYSFAVFQGQWWVVAWELPQLRILLQNTVFLIAGILALFYMYADSFVLDGKEIIGRAYRFVAGKWFLLVVACAVASAMFWWYYPFPVGHVTVLLSDGSVWQSSRLFPQTLYTIRTNLSGDNGGVWFWVQNDLVHAVNTVVKVLFAVSVGLVGWIRKAVGATT